MKKPEILAPAGSMESFLAAVHCGADAVYLGGKDLNARRNAGNFDEEALSTAVAYAHEHGTKVLQTLNIVMFDNELDELLAAAKTAAALGIDGAIVQDLGVLSILRQMVPELPLHASTQMAVHNLAGAQEAVALGCKRVVLARELTAGEIAHITQNLDAETEVFVHGALCMSVSGQCYLSSMLGGRSGNRGLCAQPCRLPFALGSGSHVLSLKDLSLVERVAELTQLGVASLKIEGRMKRPEYVAAAVTALRLALEGKSADIDTLQSVFSRSGFTTGYFDDRRDGSMFGTRQKEDVVAATGVLGELAHLADQVVPHVGVEGAFSGYADEPISLALRDADGNQAFVEGEIPQAAHTKPTDRERVAQNLEKTGGTPYYYTDLDIALDEGLMIPVSQINALRREAFAQLSAARRSPKPYRFLPNLDREHPAPLRPAGQALRLRLTLSQLTERMLFPGCEYILPLGELEAAVARGISPDAILAEIPRILFTGEETVEKLLQTAKALGISRAWCGNLGAAQLAKRAGLLPIAGWSMNLTNSYALREWKRMGGVDAEISFEVSLPKAAALGGYLPIGMVAYGFLPLMAFRNCPVKARMSCADCKRQQQITDRKGISFGVRCRDGVTELFNSVPLYLADRKNELSAFSFLTLWFTEEDAADCEAITQDYRFGSKAALPAEFTRGLYYRNVL